MRKEVDAVLKKFFAAMIIAVLMLTSQIVSAEIDWSNVQRIGSKVEFFRYVESERRKGHTKIYAVFTNGFKFASLNNLPNLLVAGIGLTAGNYSAEGNEQLTFMIREYPGTRVANAYLRGNTNDLTMDEIQLYDVAIGIVNEAKKFSSPIDRARYIHDEICRRVTFEHDRNTATGALVYGRADCDGYTDAFYMLGRMCGLNVGRIGGKAGGGNHGWNWIDLGGKVYCVDVILDDTYNSHTWFLAPSEVMRKTHSCDWSVIPNLQ